MGDMGEVKTGAARTGVPDCLNFAVRISFVTIPLVRAVARRKLRPVTSGGGVTVDSEAGMQTDQQRYQSRGKYLIKQSGKPRNREYCRSREWFRCMGIGCFPTDRGRPLRCREHRKGWARCRPRADRTSHLPAESTRQQRGTEIIGRHGQALDGDSAVFARFRNSPITRDETGILALRARARQRAASFGSAISCR